MTSVSTIYTKLLPKRPDISGTKDQAFGHRLNFLNYIVGAINAKNVAAIGMILPGNLSIQYLCGPKIHTDLAGKPLAIVRNTSNKFGKFSLAMIPLTSVKMFLSIIKKGGNTNLLKHGEDIPNEFCKDTKWYDSPAAVLPNIFLIYLGQDIPLGTIMSNNTKLAFK